MSGHHCHDEHEDGHGHSHSHAHETPLEDVPRETLYSIIDHQNVMALNVVEQVNIFKTWEERNDETRYLESDSDEQMIIRIPFVDSSVKLLSMLVKAGPGDETPSKIQLFPNEENLDFDDVEGRTPAQEFDIPLSREVGEYQLRPSKFSNVRNLALFIPAAQGADSSRIYYLGFTGTFTKISTQPVMVTYEAAPRLADHQVRGVHEAVAKQQF